MTPLQIVFVVFAAIILFVLFLVGLFFLFRTLFMHRIFIKIFGAKVYAIANEFDYYLINLFEFKLDGSKTAHLDHILFGNKYIYLIKDRYYRGQIENENGNWIYNHKRNKISKPIDNPLAINHERLEKFSLTTRINEDLLISVVLVNDKAYKDPIYAASSSDFLVSIKKLSKFIEAIEEREVPLLDEQGLQQVVLDLYELNIDNTVK
jgi:hypothetical protein